MRTILDEMLLEERWSALEDLLQEAEVSTEELQRLLRSERSGVVDMGLRYLERRLQEGRASRDLRRAWAGCLPTQRGRLAPKTEIRWASVFCRLHPSWPTQPFPGGDLSSLRSQGPSEVSLAWFRAYLLTHPSEVSGLPADAWLVQALSSLRFSDLPYPKDLVIALSESTEPWVQEIGFSLLKEGISLYAFSPTFAFERLQRLFLQAQAALQAKILPELSAPWLLLQPPPKSLLRLALQSPDPGVQSKALEACDAWGAVPLMEAFFFDPASPREKRREIMEPLGRHGGRESLRAILSTTAEDPLFFGRACFDGLQRFHQRGIFVTEDDLPTLLAIFAVHRDLFPDLLTRLTFTIRRALFEVLASLPLDSGLWEAYLPCLATLDDPGVPALLLRLLRAHRQTSLCEPLLRLLSERLIVEAEADILDLLDDRPRLALQALRFLGAEATIQRLLDKLGLEPPTDAVASALLPYQEDALSLLWHLLPTYDPRRQAILAKLDPASIPKAILADLQIALRPPDLAFFCEDALSSLRAHEALRLFCRYAIPEDLPFLRSLLTRYIQELHAGEITPEEASKPGFSAEPLIASEIREAIKELGLRWAQQDKLRPVCLLRGSHITDAGDLLLSSLLLEILADDALTAGEEGIVIEALIPLRDPWIVSRIFPLLRSKEPHLRKVVIRCLAEQRATGLLAALGALTRADDPQTVRQALLALRDLGARHTGYLVTACLEHPSMLIKKTAAEVLQSIGTIDAIPALLRWLIRHDNPGFRASLLRALDALLGSMATAALLTALETHTSHDEQEALLLTLGDRLSSVHLVGLVRSQSPVAPLLLQAFADGKLRLIDGDLQRLAETFSDADLPLPPSLALRPPAKAKAEDLSPVIRALQEEGWQAEGARLALLETPAPSSMLASLIRRDLPLWLALFPTLRDREKEEFLRLFLHPCPQDFTPRDRTALATCFRFFLPFLPRLEAQAKALLEIAFLVRPYLRPIEQELLIEDLRQIRVLPPGEGLLFLQVLRFYETSLTRVDLETLLASCDRTADPPRLRYRLLSEIFPLPASPPSPPPAFTSALDEAIRTPQIGPLDTLRRESQDLPTASLLRPLLQAYTEAFYHQTALLDWILDLQPLNLPLWQALPDHHRKEGRPASPKGRRKPETTDLQDLLAITALDASHRKYEALWPWLWKSDGKTSEIALSEFVSWSDLRPLRPFLARIYLHHPSLERLPLALEEKLAAEIAASPGRLLLSPPPSWDDPPPPPALPLSTEAAPPSLAADLETALRALPLAAQRKVLRLLHALPSHQAEDALPWLFPLAFDPGTFGAEIAAFLSGLSADRLLPYVVAAVSRGQIASTRLLQTALTSSEDADRLLLLLRSENPEEAERLRSLLQRRGLRTEAEKIADQALLTALGKRPPPKEEDKISPQEREGQLLQTLQATEDPEAFRLAVKALLAWKDQRPSPPSAETLAFLQEKTFDRDKRIRGIAHRALRRVASKEVFLQATLPFLHDPRPDVQRSAIRTLSYARYLPALQAIIGLLLHKKPSIRAAAAKGLALYEEAALPALTYAASHARPDHAGIYEALLQRICEDLGIDGSSLRATTSDPPGGTR